MSNYRESYGLSSDTVQIVFPNTPRPGKFVFGVDRPDIIDHCLWLPWKEGADGESGSLVAYIANLKNLAHTFIYSTCKILNHNTL